MAQVQNSPQLTKPDSNPGLLRAYKEVKARWEREDRNGKILTPREEKTRDDTISHFKKTGVTDPEIDKFLSSNRSVPEQTAHKTPTTSHSRSSIPAETREPRSRDIRSSIEATAQSPRMKANEFQHKHTMAQIENMGRPSAGSSYMMNERLNSLSDANGNLDMNKLRADRAMRDFRMSPGGEDMYRRFGPGSALMQSNSMASSSATPQRSLDPEFQRRIKQLEEKNILKSEEKILANQGDITELSKGSYHIRDEKGSCKTTNYEGYCRQKAEASTDKVEKSQWLSQATEASEFSKARSVALKEKSHIDDCAKLNVDPDKYSPQEIARYNKLERIVRDGLTTHRPTREQRKAFLEICKLTGETNPQLALNAHHPRMMNANHQASVSDVKNENFEASKSTTRAVDNLVTHNAKNTSDDIGSMRLPKVPIRNVTVHESVAQAQTPSMEKSVEMSSNRKEFFEQFREMYRSGNIPSANQVSFPQDNAELHKMKQKMEGVLASSDLRSADKKMYNTFVKFLDSAIEEQSNSKSPFA